MRLRTMKRDVYSPLPLACHFNSCRISGVEDAKDDHCLRQYDMVTNYYEHFAAHLEYMATQCKPRGMSCDL
jgi:hypothetical protein